MGDEDVPAVQVQDNTRIRDESDDEVEDGSSWPESGDNNKYVCCNLVFLFHLHIHFRAFLKVLDARSSLQSML